MNQNTGVGFGATFVIGVIVILSFLIGGWTVVKTGYVGVVTHFGAVSGKVLDPGFHVKLPFFTNVKKMNVQTNKEQADATAASSDLQNVNATIAVNYSVNKGQVVALYSTIGTGFKATVIDPFIQESVKAVTANYTAEELITKRDAVSQDIQKHLSDRLTPDGIIVQNISIVNFKFSDSFEQAIEAKVTAEQDALAAKNKLAQVQYEAQQAVEEANGKAKALTIEASAISTNSQILQLRAIEKWDGHLPQVTSGATPFINVK